MAGIDGSGGRERVGSLAAFQGVLRREGVRFMVQDTGDAISLPVALGGSAGFLHVRWEPTPRVVHVVLPMPLRVPPGRLPDAALVLARINHRLAVPGFHLNPDTGVPSFRAVALLDADGTIEVGLLRGLLTTALDTVGRFLDDLRELAGAP